MPPSLWKVRMCELFLWAFSPKSQSYVVHDFFGHLQVHSRVKNSLLPRTRHCEIHAAPGVAGWVLKIVALGCFRPEKRGLAGLHRETPKPRSFFVGSATTQRCGAIFQPRRAGQRQRLACDGQSALLRLFWPPESHQKGPENSARPAP